MFIAALLTIAKLWKHPDAVQQMNGSRKSDIYMHKIMEIHDIYIYMIYNKNNGDTWHIYITPLYIYNGVLLSPQS
jgi:hypothetical protein